MAFRSAALLVLWALSTYISLAHRFLWPLPDFAVYIRSPFIHLFIVSFLLLLSMLFGLDVLGKGLRDLARLSPAPKRCDARLRKLAAQR
jgi:hypothetical protein